MAIIPLMVKAAPALGMIDKPDPRKVHLSPIPRVGGVGIVIGSLIPIMVWTELDTQTWSFIFGALVLLIFGAWDDAKELGHYVKFIGQFIAVIAVVYVGDLYVYHLPFAGYDPIPESLGKPFTVIAMVGMINAINHSDGLDGLAGGESLLTLVALAYLAYAADGIDATLTAIACIGGVFGFLRFNSHPARVFMGDGGSQFLGFTLGYLAVVLTQQVNTALSPALPALLLGLPVADILAVFYQRISGGMNWFKATKNHIHHRLLERGFHHYEAVGVIYAIHAGLVIAGVILAYEADWLLLSIYLATCIMLFTWLYMKEQSDWHAHSSGGIASFSKVILAVVSSTTSFKVALRIVEYGVVGFVLFSSITATSIDREYALPSIALCMALLIRLIMGYRAWFLFLRLTIYVSIALIAYVFGTNPHTLLTDAPQVEYVYFGLLTLGLVMAIRNSNQQTFRITPLDYLVILLILALNFLPIDTAEADRAAEDMTWTVAKTIILFYCSELILKNMKSRWNVFTVSILIALGVIAYHAY